MVTPINFLLIQLDPNYQMGFYNGYEYAKKEIMEKLNVMNPFKEESGTFEILKEDRTF